MTAPSDLRIDLTDPDLYVPDGVMFDVWDRLRESAPIYWNEREGDAGFWALTSHRLASMVYENRTDFTSERGMRVGGEGASGRASSGKMMIVTDGSRHRQMREILGPAFSTKGIAQLEEGMRQTFDDLIESVADLESFDFVDRIAARLPLYVTCQLLGIPRSDWDRMIYLTRTAFGSVYDQEVSVISPEEQEEAHAEIFLHGTELIAERRRNPGDDLISAMLHSEASGGYRMTDEEIQININAVLTGGNETTRHATSAGVLGFIRSPELWVRLREHRELMPRAIEEILRISAPSLQNMRTAVCDTVVGTERVRAGQQVTIWNPAVNHDGEEFPEPRKFDIDRWPNRHLSFGKGEHFCIGAKLARLELRVALENMLSRIHHFELVGDIRRLRSNVMWGIDTMPVRLHVEGRK